MIDIAAANPKLFAVVQELVEVAQMRSNIMLMKKYLTVCRIASEEKLLLNLVSRQHFVDGPNLYSMQDLMDVKNGTLLPYLQRITGKFHEFFFVEFHFLYLHLFFLQDYLVIILQTAYFVKQRALFVNSVTTIA